MGDKNGGLFSFKLLLLRGGCKDIKEKKEY